MKKYICLFMILTTLISAFFIGCQKNTNQLEKVDIIVNSENETIDKNTNSVSVNFNQKEYEEIISKINKEYHFRVYLCDKDYLNSDNPIHNDIYRDITVELQN